MSFQNHKLFLNLIHTFSYSNWSFAFGYETHKNQYCGVKQVSISRAAVNGNIFRVLKSKAIVLPHYFHCMEMSITNAKKKVPLGCTEQNKLVQV